MAEASVTSVEQMPQAVVVHVGARNLGKSEVDDLCKAIDTARAAAPALPFILDLAKVYYAPSSALGVIVGLNQEFRNRGQRLVFVNLQDTIKQAINITRLGSLLQILPDIPAALKGIGGGT